MTAFGMAYTRAEAEWQQSLDAYNGEGAARIHERDQQRADGVDVDGPIEDEEKS
jgi:hypothetical protein